MNDFDRGNLLRFEEYAKEKGWRLYKQDGQYVDARTYGAWEAWKLATKVKKPTDEPTRWDQGYALGEKQGFDQGSADKAEAVEEEQKLCAEFIREARFMPLEYHVRDCCKNILRVISEMIKDGKHREVKKPPPNDVLVRMSQEAWDWVQSRLGNRNDIHLVKSEVPE